MAKAQFTVTRGDTFVAEATYTDSTGAVVDLTGFSVACEARANGRVYPFTCVVTDASAGVYTISAAAGTTRLWEPGEYEADIQYTVGSVVSSTDIFPVVVVKDITGAN